ncbi:3,4-dihydroxy-2-butanone-4-phosphate synthase [Acinetobacter cumulans]|jgi:3,4-dihydroxy 2-butanone 4-phosphate synthase|uniref:3,4-dihydroxy-2-butanone 4-phosphate synthase n=1 Tax=Acinetobacter cumulans TaxID=2136182 RepID=A0A498D182_9GAMM|nr:MULTISPECIES: 3,4-dihydroxy-2-butanone-4-phosphate synthase [Acinetobacter]QCO22983.1 3,4-dihydroxy-2-butanone-4-phosphate synthase [Acinetobacter cumulans]QFU78804.1 3,4-dihydroxy-2-butanone-4-phosphate synthase [Acinetobacter cumulans]RFS36154.1 3,4-dihydroxy-2-butanone-4-phosphate synthase [Acinetobacter sp. SWAC5]RKG48197.1 3,4-dihydroxy-2-butanone-4-phosphate synthase [Acinetobacter cumulans]RLL35545.1 3,4-dihydroxy-2-butanone-4-phosphate synthase [Acinetobacter cumulans]
MSNLIQPEIFFKALPPSEQRVLQALEDIRQGKPVLVMDDFDRENEADLIVAAETLNVETMARMIRDGSGIVCFTLTNALADHLELPPMVQNNSSQFKTAFTVTIEAAQGVTTGVSAQDRTTTIHAAIKTGAVASDLNRPGHVFPLRARDGGVLSRRGHTEASIDLARLAGLQPAGVLCEVTNPDGSMASGKQVLDYANEHKLTLINIEELVQYRQAHNL